MSNNPFNLFNSFAASFLHEVDDLVAVLALVGSAGDVDPVDVAVAERSNLESLKCGDKSKSFIVV